MKTGLASGGTLLVVANSIRLGSAPNSAPTPFDLWRLADREARGQGPLRRELYRHASIHAGLLRTKRGTVYRRCGICGESLE